jgi:hypothetical protein
LVTPQLRLTIILGRIQATMQPLRRQEGTRSRRGELEIGDEERREETEDRNISEVEIELRKSL